MVKKTDKTGFLFIFYFSEVGYPGSYRGGKEVEGKKRGRGQAGKLGRGELGR